MVLGWPTLRNGKLLLLTSKICMIFLVYKKMKISSVLSITLKWGTTHNLVAIKYSSMCAKQLIVTVLEKLPYCCIGASTRGGLTSSLPPLEGM
jgi:hypothetical protein